MPSDSSLCAQDFGRLPESQGKSFPGFFIGPDRERYTVSLAHSVSLSALSVLNYSLSRVTLDLESGKNDVLGSA